MDRLQTTRAHSGAPSQSTSSFAVSEVCTKFCTLMLNDAPCVEQIALRDPVSFFYFSESRRKSFFNFLFSFSIFSFDFFPKAIMIKDISVEV